jgi:hypothetical protein
LKKFRRYSTPASRSFDYGPSGGRAGSYDSAFRRADERPDYRDDRSEGGRYQRYEEVKDDYMDSGRARDERPVGGHYSNYFNDDKRDSPREPKPDLIPSSVNKMKWGQK